MAIFHLNKTIAIYDLTLEITKFQQLAPASYDFAKFDLLKTNEYCWFVNTSVDLFYHENHYFIINSHQRYIIRCFIISNNIY